ncbi:hypothetical protein QTI66_32660 [Variovorax sp. J22R133]|uniref:hypothetical protein n=1 Tax=Variovorax brevis TaxID=3053503 RepID=UPI002577D080|nr:hypothetical protein [Variovorax sp. J22R133]MDM0116880.1 hypothetical protein [Variovorax sp. J22R133]
MGYRSEVVYMLAGEPEAMKRELAAFRMCFPMGKEQQELFREIQHIYPKSDDDPDQLLVLKYAASDVKWYPDFEDVKMMNALYSHFEGVQDGADEGTPEAAFNGAWSRVGEEENDAEHSDFGDEGYELCPVSRTIDCLYD